MSLRKKTHADYPAIIRSRRGYTGNLSKLSEKLSEMMELDISQVSVRAVEGLVTSCTTSETRYLNTLDDAHAFLSKEDNSEDLLEEEEAAVDQFQQTVAEVKEQAATLISLKGCARLNRKLSRLSGMPSLPDRRATNQLLYVSFLSTMTPFSRNGTTAAMKKIIHSSIRSKKTVLTSLSSPVKWPESENVLQHQLTTFLPASP